MRADLKETWSQRSSSIPECGAVVMCCSGTAEGDAEDKKLKKFVELLVHDYLNSRGFHGTEAKFAEDHGAEDNTSGVRGTGRRDADDASSWYCLTEKLALAELLQRNNPSNTTGGRRFTSVIEVLVQEMVSTRENRTKTPGPHASVSMVRSRVSKAKRRQLIERTGLDVTLPRYVTSILSEASTTKTEGDSGDVSATVSKGTAGENTLSHSGTELNNKEILASGHASSPAGAESAAVDGKESCKTSPLQSLAKGSRMDVNGKGESREGNRRHTGSTKRLQGNTSPTKGTRRSRESSMMPNKFQFNKDSIRRHQMSQESRIPMDLRMKMMRRSMAVMQENVDESVAQDRLVRKEKKRTDRSELEIVKIQEKFGTKHQRPCALCEQSFSEVNLVLAVPFKAIVDLRLAWQKTLPQAGDSTTKANRTMFMPPQCYNEVKVCAFCSQLFHDPLGYRPTWEMEIMSMRKKKEELAREKEREYWDPLRSHTFSARLTTHATGGSPVATDDVLHAASSITADA